MFVDHAAMLDVKIWINKGFLGYYRSGDSNSVIGEGLPYK
jgi:hypothetical protein